MIYKRASLDWWSISSLKTCSCDVESENCQHYKKIDDEIMREIILEIMQTHKVYKM